MTKTDHYKNLWKDQKEETRKLKITVDELTTSNEKLIMLASRLSYELVRTRSRKWWQFWKFFKWNRIEDTGGVLIPIAEGWVDDNTLTKTKTNENS